MATIYLAIKLMASFFLLGQNEAFTLIACFAMVLAAELLAAAREEYKRKLQEKPYEMMDDYYKESIILLRKRRRILRRLAAATIKKKFKKTTSSMQRRFSRLVVVIDCNKSNVTELTMPEGLEKDGNNKKAGPILMLEASKREDDKDDAAPIPLTMKNNDEENNPEDHQDNKSMKTENEGSPKDNDDTHSKGRTSTLATQSSRRNTHDEDKPLPREDKTTNHTPLAATEDEASFLLIYDPPPTCATTAISSSKDSDDENKKKNSTNPARGGECDADIYCGESGTHQSDKATTTGMVICSPQKEAMQAAENDHDSRQPSRTILVHAPLKSEEKESTIKRESFYELFDFLHETVSSTLADEGTKEGQESSAGGVNEEEQTTQDDHATTDTTVLLSYSSQEENYGDSQSTARTMAVQSFHSNKKQEHHHESENKVVSLGGMMLQRETLYGREEFQEMLANTLAAINDEKHENNGSYGHNGDTDVNDEEAAEDLFSREPSSFLPDGSVDYFAQGSAAHRRRNDEWLDDLLSSSESGNRSSSDGSSGRWTSDSSHTHPSRNYQNRSKSSATQHHKEGVNSPMNQQIGWY